MKWLPAAFFAADFALACHLGWWWFSAMTFMAGLCISVYLCVVMMPHFIARGTTDIDDLGLPARERYIVMGWFGFAWLMAWPGVMSDGIAVVWLAVFQLTADMPDDELEDEEDEA